MPESTMPYNVTLDCAAALPLDTASTAPIPAPASAIAKPVLFIWVSLL
jgi:hypothetical protein